MTPITLSLRSYLAHGRAGSRVCFSCRQIGVPLPPSCSDLHGMERRCFACMRESALPLEIALREGWLAVVDDDGRVLNDTRQAAESR